MWEVLKDLVVNRHYYIGEVFAFIFPAAYEHIRKTQTDEVYRSLDTDRVVHIIRNRPWWGQLLVARARVCFWKGPDAGIYYLRTLDGTALASVTDGGTAHIFGEERILGYPNSHTARKNVNVLLQQKDWVTCW